MRNKWNTWYIVSLLPYVKWHMPSRLVACPIIFVIWITISHKTQPQLLMQFNFKTVFLLHSITFPVYLRNITLKFNPWDCSNCYILATLNLVIWPYIYKSLPCSTVTPFPDSLCSYYIQRWIFLMNIIWSTGT